MSHGYESDHEEATIDRLKFLRYTHIHGSDLDREYDEVVLTDILRANLAKRYPKLADSALDQAVEHISSPDGPTLLHRNMAFHAGMLTRGFELPVESTAKDGKPVREIFHIHPIDWDQPDANKFHVVNQLSISGKNDRRPDIVIFINGLPLVLFELKNPYAEKPTVDHAFNQIQHYSVDLPKLFEYNTLCVLSDGMNVLHGMWTANMEWFAPWNTMDGKHVESGRTGSMKTLIGGLFPRERLLDYIRNYIAFDIDKDKIIKKGAKYHQFFGVRAAVSRTRDAFEQYADNRIGVIWHTPGAGKSLSMAYLVGILRREQSLKNPTFVIQVDRTDLDGQLHDQFVRIRHLVGAVKHAGRVDELRELLRSEGGEVIFTTIEKFALKRGSDGTPAEVGHPVLSTRDNIIVIADEAHRTQYGFTQGFARYLSEALPNAKRLGFTGTPISFHGADTQEVFGDYIHTYDILQSEEDGATVPIYYTVRQAKLHLSDKDIDKALNDAADDEGLEGQDFEKRKSRWAALGGLAGTTERVEAIAEDLLGHYRDRTATLDGKAMIVCMTRRNCVRMYDALTALPNCPEIKIIMTGDITVDPKEWNESGHITTKAQRDALKERVVDPDDPLKLAIVCDMWQTGTDIPCLHTIYIDKPIRGHNMIQAISRVNRVFRDKPHGLVVDYIGVGEELRKATSAYTGGGGTGDPAPDVNEVGVPLFFECLTGVLETLPDGKVYDAWRHLSPVEFEDLHMEAYGYLSEDEQRRDAFLLAELRLTNAFLLVKHIDECRKHADEVIFFQRVRKQINKVVSTPKTKRTALDEAIRDIVDDHVDSEGVVDIFKLSGIETPDISILDDNFLQTFKDKPHENLRLKLLQRLMADEIRLRAQRNIAKAKSFRDLLQETMDRYHKRTIDAAAVIKALIAIKKEMEADAERAKTLGLSEEELAFYDAVHEHYVTIYDEPFLRDLIHDVVQVVKKNLKVDWTEPHRDSVKAAVRAAVRRTLRKRGVKPDDFEVLVETVIAQAESLWKEWPMAS